MITDKQATRYRRRREAGRTQEAAAAAADITAKTGRKWEVGPLPSEIEKAPRDWRTRKDPMVAYWDKEAVPWLTEDTEGILEATALFEHIKSLFPQDAQDEHLRTFQRRVRDWRAVNGLPKEVFFEQRHVAGREAQFDFTHATELKVTIAGEAFPHLLFELLLSFSKHRYVEIARGETFEALCSGLQNGFGEIGGVTKVVRSDNLSAATHELAQHEGRELTPRFKALLEHYSLESTRIRARQSNENGIVEKGHDVLKRALKQALILRGSRDFRDLEEYQRFLAVIVDRLNQKKQVKFAEEQLALGSLPSSRIPTYTDIATKVMPWSYVRVGGNIYSVNSRLIGHQVIARVHADQVDILYNGKVVEQLTRLRGKGNQRIDYRHVVHTLVQKPGAFARYRFREEMFPTLTFRLAYDSLVRQRGERADVEYLRILQLAATTYESEVGAALTLLMDVSDKFDYVAVKALVTPSTQAPIVDQRKLVPNLPDFDTLLTGALNAQLTGNQVPAHC